MAYKVAGCVDIHQQHKDEAEAEKGLQPHEEGKKLNVSEVLKKFNRLCTIDILDEISLRIRGCDFSSRINERIRNTIKEELEKELVNLEAEKAEKEREMEML